MNLAMQDLVMLPKFLIIFVCLNFIFKPPHPNPLLSKRGEGITATIFFKK